MNPINSSTCYPQLSGSAEAGNSRNSDAVAQGTSRPRSTEEYLASWFAWEKNAPPGGGEIRDIAVARMRECLENNKLLLDLSILHLTSLPEWLPENIEKLDAHRNYIQKIPDNLPSSLVMLEMTNNDLKEIPDTLPHRLQRLYLANNKIEKIPENLPNTLERLFLARNRIACLPNKLPDNLEMLYLIFNELTTLPNNLPGMIKNLHLGYNRLSEFPQNLPNSIVNLNVSGNELRNIPSNSIPQYLITLNLTDNRLTDLPELPQSLRTLDLRKNHFRTLPESILQHQGLEFVTMENNRLSQYILQRTIARTSLANYSGPRISFDLSGDHPNVSAYPLVDSVQEWLPASLSETSRAQWIAIDQQQGAAAFSDFLRRLSLTINAQDNPAFRARVADWLTRMADAPELREASLTVASDATTSCEDRVTLAWNSMQKAVLIEKVKSGLFDNKLSDLIATGIEMFRLEKIEQIARDKVKTLNFVDEIEVYLAYQVGLKEALELNTVEKEMRFGNFSNVNQGDLNRALANIREQEKREFSTWLTQWEPWKMALERANPPWVQSLLEQQSEAFDENYQQRLVTEIETNLLKAVPEAEVALGKQVWDEMRRENDSALTGKFLQKHYLTLMADKSPPEALKVVTELATVAALSPDVAAMAIRPENVDEEHLSSLMAAVVAKGDMEPLAEAWISLLHLLYQNNSLSREETLSALLPHKPHDKINSLAHAVAGAAWYSAGATQLSALLSEIARSDEKSRQEIVTRLSLEQMGYGFKQGILNPSADFYNRVKHADKLTANDSAKALLKQSGLIPENRELYPMASVVPSGSINWSTENPHSDFASLKNKIVQEIAPQVLASHVALEKEQAVLE